MNSGPTTTYTLPRKTSIMRKFMSGFILGVLILGITSNIYTKIHHRNEWIRVNRETLPERWQQIVDAANRPKGDIWQYINSDNGVGRKLPTLTKEQAEFLALYQGGKAGQKHQLFYLITYTQP